jgi:3-hydroxybutyryl-CoA dehydrogenase
VQSEVNRSVLREILDEIKPSSSERQRIKNVAVIGVGVMGRGIVQTIAQAGFDVIAVEKDEESLNLAKEKLEEALDYEIQRWAMTKSEKKSILSRIEWTTEIEDVKECELVIEAVDEDFELKKRFSKSLIRFAHHIQFSFQILQLFHLQKFLKLQSELIKLLGCTSQPCTKGSTC